MSDSVTVVIRGAIDHAGTDGLLQGWCWSPDEPNVHRTIVLRLDGAPIATVTCDHLRPGLVQAGIGDGRSAFNLVIPAHAAVLREGSVISAADTTTGITFGEVVVTRAVNHSQLTEVQRAPAVEGHLDGVSADGVVNGWCWFPEFPDRHAEVVIVVDSEPVGTAIADSFRADLRDAGVGTGAHALAFTLPRGDISKPVVYVSLYEASSWTMVGEPTELRTDSLPRDRLGTEARPAPAPVSPLPALPLPPAVDGSLDSVSVEGVVAGWCWYPGEPNRHVDVRIMVDDHHVSTITAGSYRLDLQEAGIGRGDHGVVSVLPWESIAEKRIARVTFYDTATGSLIGKPFMLRRRGIALLDQRVRELEQQVRLLRSRLEETMRLRSVGSDQATRELFQTIGTFFTQLADGRQAHGAAELRAMLDDLSSRYRQLHLAVPSQPVATICIDASAPVDSLHACIAALQSARIDQQADIFVINDGAFETSTLLPTLVRNLNYIHLGPTDSLLAGRNEAAFNLDTPIVVFLAPEMRVVDSWLTALRQTLEHDPRAAIAGSHILREDGVSHHTGLLVDGRGRLQAPVPLSAALAREVDALGDLAFAVRREDFVQVGGFDLAFAGTAAATFDLCLRLRAAGRTVLQQPQSLAYVSPRGSADDERVVTDLERPDEDTRRLRQRWLSTSSGGLGLPPSSQVMGQALVIDSVIPRPDEDAGSIATAEQMQLLRRLGYHVSFAASTETVPNISRAEALQRQGIELICPPLYESVSDYLDQHGRTLDLVVVYRHGNMHTLLDRLPALAPKAKRVFVPCDLHYLREQRAMLLSGNVNELLVNAVRAEELACARGSDMTLLASDYEMEALRTEIEDRKLRLLRWIARGHPPEREFGERLGICFIAGFAHKPNEDAVLWFVQEIMPLILEDAPEIRLHIVGSQMPATVRALAGPNVVVHGWVRDLVPILESVRLTIAPLRYGAGFKGKVATSLAHGVPVVGTQIALEGTGLAEEDGVLFADGARDFARAVLRLHGDRRLWIRLSVRAVERCETLYSENAALAVFSGMLKDLGLPSRTLPAISASP
jgi:glycosyltransferase involved in cell wall biosynthesis